MSSVTASFTARVAFRRLWWVGLLAIIVSLVVNTIVRHYMTNILQKLHVRSRVEAALLAQKAGLGETH